MRLGVVIQWASAFFELRKNVSGIQIFPTMLLLRRRTFMVLLNFNLLSYQVWAKKMSMVYSWEQRNTFYFSCQVWLFFSKSMPAIYSMAHKSVCLQRKYVKFDIMATFGGKKHHWVWHFLKQLQNSQKNHTFKENFLWKQLLTVHVGFLS